MEATQIDREHEMVGGSGGRRKLHLLWGEGGWIEERSEGGQIFGPPPTFRAKVELVRAVVGGVDVGLLGCGSAKVK